MFPTAYSEVNQILHIYEEKLAQILGKQFYALYLSGSLATGDFNLNSSDIDVLVVTQTKLSTEMIAQLAAMHQELQALDTKWGIEIEAAYIPLADVRRYDFTHAMHPQIERGPNPLRVAHLDQSWIIQRHIIREYGIPLKGPAPKSIIAPVTPAQIRQIALNQFYSLCYPQIENPIYLDIVGSKSYIILTICRILYTLEHNTVASKSTASNWLLQQDLTEPLKILIRQALHWGETGENIEIKQSDIIDLIHYTDSWIKTHGYSDQ